MASGSEISHSSPKSWLTTCAFIIPTYNAAKYWPGLQRALEAEGVEGRQVLVVDSMSTDNTRELVNRAGYQLITIPSAEFRHGATRQMAAEHMDWAETLIFLTQDAVPAGDRPLSTLLSAFDDPSVGAAYGRQLPRADAGGIERHARMFNYPCCSALRTFESRKDLGFRAAFFSNSFAAYRSEAFHEVGGFPKDVIVSEEVTLIARMLLAGWSVSYRADATVVHSHPMTICGEFSRYFDIAVHHSRERWLIGHFGSTGGEGLRYVVSEFRYLARTAPQLIPLATIRNVSKWLAYQIGMKERHLPLWSKRVLTGQPQYWQKHPAEEEVPKSSHLLNQ